MSDKNKKHLTLSTFWKKYSNYIFFLLVAVLTVAILIKEVDFDLFIEIIKDAKLQFLGIGCLSMIVYWLLETYLLLKLIRPEYPDETFGHAFVIMIIGQFYNLITPGASGGQPLQLYEMVQRGIQTGFGTAVLVQKYALYQLSVTLVGVVSIFFNIDQIMLWPAIGKTMVIFGALINLAGSFLVILIAVKPVFAKGALSFLVNVGAWLHIIKDKDKYYRKIDHFVEDYQVAISALQDRVPQTILLFIINMIAVVVYFGITYWIYRSLALDQASFLRILGLQAILYLVFAFIPLPGGSGGAEVGFTLVFGTIFGAGRTGVAMVTWRLITFYFILCFGGLFISIRSLTLGKKEVKKLESVSSKNTIEGE